MSLPKVFVTRIIPPEAQEILNRVAEIEIWPQDTKPPQEIIIHGANLLVVGLGRIGLEVCRRAIGFGMEIFYHSRTRKLNLEKELGINYVSKLKDGISKADFISINTIMNDQTYHLFGKEEFNTMKNSAIIVNTARGPIIDMESLYEALKNNQIAGAAVDVTEPEPIPKLFNSSNLNVTKWGTIKMHFYFFRIVCH